MQSELHDFSLNGYVFEFRAIELLFYQFTTVRSLVIAFG